MSLPKGLQKGWTHPHTYTFTENVSSAYCATDIQGVVLVRRELPVMGNFSETRGSRWDEWGWVAMNVPEGCYGINHRSEQVY